MPNNDKYGGDVVAVALDLLRLSENSVGDVDAPTGHVQYVRPITMRTILRKAIKAGFLRREVLVGLLDAISFDDDVPRSYLLTTDVDGRVSIATYGDDQAARDELRRIDSEYIDWLLSPFGTWTR